MGPRSHQQRHEPDAPDRRDHQQGARIIDLRLRPVRPELYSGDQRSVQGWSELWQLVEQPESAPEQTPPTAPDAAVAEDDAAVAEDDAIRELPETPPSTPSSRGHDTLEALLFAAGAATSRAPTIGAATTGAATTDPDGRHTRAEPQGQPAVPRRSRSRRRAEVLSRRRAAKKRRRRRLALGALSLGLAVVAVIAAVATVTRVLPERDASSRWPTSWSLSADAKSWLEDNAARGAEIAAPAEFQHAVASSLPRHRVRSYASAKARSAGLLVVPPLSGAPRDGTIHELLATSERVAAFGDGTQVRQLLNGKTPAQARAERRAFGRRIVNDNRIGLTPVAWRVLVAGDVDPRLMGLLQRVANVHRIEIYAFPRERAERGARAPARQMHVLAVDGRLVNGTSGSAASLVTMMRGLPPPYAPAEIGRPRLAGAPPGLLVHFHLPESG